MTGTARDGAIVGSQVDVEAEEEAEDVAEEEVHTEAAGADMVRTVNAAFVLIKLFYLS